MAVSDIPTAQAFKELAGLLKPIRHGVFCALTDSADWIPWMSISGPRELYGQEYPPKRREQKIDRRLFSESGRERIARDAYNSRKEAFGAMEDSDAGRTFAWLDKQQSFESVMRRLNLVRLNEHDAINCYSNYLRVSLEHRMATGPGWSLNVAHSVSFFSAKFYSWLSDVCEAVCGYLSGERLHIASNGRQMMLRAQSLVNELAQLLDDPALQGLTNHRDDWRLDKMKERLDYAVFSMGKVRKDGFLAERLLAADLLKTNRLHYGKPNSALVYDLLNLPLVENYLEIRTIDRVWTSIRKDEQEAALQRVLLRREKERQKLA